MIDLDFESASFHVGGKVEEKHLTELGDRTQRLQGGKIFIPKFIPFQYGELSTTCPAHNPVFRLISIHQLTRTEIGYQYPSHRVVDKEEERNRKRNGKEEGVQGEKPRIKDSTVIPNLLASSPEFLGVWSRWLSHLKEKRKPATLHAQDLQLRDCAEWGITRAIRAIEHSIKSGYQGVYEPKEFSNPKSPRPVHQFITDLQKEIERNK